MHLTDDLRAWHDFFLLAGGASATLMGLVFVSVSLTRGFESVEEANRERGLFVTPIVFQFGYALAISSAAVAPWTDARWFGWFALVAGLAATAQNIRLLRGMWVRHHASDPVTAAYWLWNGWFPFFAAVLMIASGVLMIATGEFRPELVALATLALDLLGVSNAWRLIIYIIGHSKD